MIGEFIDRAISLVSPVWGLQRIAARATISQIEAFSGTGQGGYDAGKHNRLTQGRLGSRVKENAIPIIEVQRLRWQAWHLWRNNGHARKIVRSIKSKTIGNGMIPTSQAVDADGNADTAFRDRARQLWDQLATNFDYRGVPGQGGLDTVGLAKLALQSAVVGGELLYRLMPITARQQKERGLPIPATLMLIDAERLATGNQFPLSGAEIPEGNHVYRGIELDSDGRRVAYWLYTYPIGAIAPVAADAKRIEADQLFHLFIEDDIDQYRGVSWFAPSLLDLRDVGDYKYNELKSSAMAACVVLGYRRATGATQLGLNQPTTADMTDADGNQVRSIQPGMFVNLGKDGGLEGFNPQRNGANVEGFAQFMLRGIAGAAPGVKPSTVTGDYRNASFSSERAADNDCWPEIEDVQDWFAAGWYQPWWEKCLDLAVASGFFAGIVDPQAYIDNRSNYVRTKWQGPVNRSINPTDDAKSAGLRVAGLQSPLQHECAAVGTDWRENIRAMAEVYKFAAEAGAPKNAIDHLFGINVTEQIQESTVGGDASDVEGVQGAQTDAAEHAASLIPDKTDNSGGTKKEKGKNGTQAAK